MSTEVIKRSLEAVRAKTQENPIPGFVGLSIQTLVGVKLFREKILSIEELIAVY